MAKYYTKKIGKKKGYKKNRSYKKKMITKRHNKKQILKKRFSKKGGSAKRPLTDPELFQSQKISRQEMNNNDHLLVDPMVQQTDLQTSIPQTDLDKLNSLGFEDDELEMFFSEFGNKTNELIEKYLEISSQYPGYETFEEASNSDYLIPNTDLNKHDIAEQVLSSYYE